MRDRSERNQFTHRSLKELAASCAGLLLRITQWSVACADISSAGLIFEPEIFTVPDSLSQSCTLDSAALSLEVSNSPSCWRRASWTFPCFEIRAKLLDRNEETLFQRRNRSSMNCSRALCRQLPVALRPCDRRRKSRYGIEHQQTAFTQNTSFIFQTFVMRVLHFRTTRRANNQHRGLKHFEAHRSLQLSEQTRESRRPAATRAYHQLC